MFKGNYDSRTHTEAEYDEIKAAYAVGFSHAAHFYNAMPGFHKRREYKYEGTVESVYLTDGMTVEVIADGIHLPATILKLVYKLKGVENTCLVLMRWLMLPMKGTSRLIRVILLRTEYVRWRIILH